jgi:hypothetical protein
MMTFADHGIEISHTASGPEVSHNLPEVQPRAPEEKRQMPIRQHREGRLGVSSLRMDWRPGQG